MKLFKTILTYIIIFADLFILIGIIGFIGIKALGQFSLAYFIGLVIATIILCITRNMNEFEWKTHYKLNNNKVKWWKVAFIFPLIAGGLFASKWQNPFALGLFVGLMIPLYFSLFCKDFLYMLVMFRESIDSLLLTKKWIKR